MERSNTPVFFGEWLKKRRKALDLTQEELAQRAGCSVFALRKIESGERRPSKQLAELLAQSLEISSEEMPVFIKIARGQMSLGRLHASASNLPIPSLADFQIASPPSTIPLQPTPLIGREAEMTAMEKLFENPQCRLLTLTGMGGIGKTRLAIEFASRQTSAFQGGVFYIPLTAINVADAMIPAIADALGFAFSGPVNPKEQLLNYIANWLRQPVLLILDNLEHLLVPLPGNEYPGVIELVSEFLQRLSNIRILATSREHLNLRGEWIYELHGLPVPSADFSGKLEDYSAVALFVQCAQQANVDFQITGQNRLAVIKICQLLDGIPLAIELATAWVGMLSCQEIAHEIDSNLDFLSTTIRDVPERHRSVHASFSHSWELLSGQEQEILCRLAVFQGGFDRIAAEQVVGASLSLLASLVSKSLVHRMEDSRYDLHEVIRQYALSYLGTGQSELNTRDLHCSYYLKFVADRESALKSAAQQEALREITTEMDNIRAAWIYAINHEKFFSTGETIRSLGWFFETTGLLDEGIDQFELLVKALKDKSSDRDTHAVLGLALMQQGLLYFRKGQFSRARTLYEESLGILRPIGDPSLLTDALVFLGIILFLDGEYEQARSTLNEGLTSARAGKDKWFAAYALYNLGYVDSLLGLHEEGYEKMIAGLGAWRTFGDPHSIALGLNFLIPTLIELERYEEAESYLQESIYLCAQSRNRWGMGTAYRQYGLLKLVQGNALEAQLLFRKSLDVFADFVVGWDIARTLNYLGEAAFSTGDLSEARKIYLKALRLSVDEVVTPIMLDSILGIAYILAETGEIDASIRLSNYVSIHPASTHETKDRAQRLIARLRKVSKHRTDKTWPEGLEMKTIDDIANEILGSG
jgi:predicted ATPase/transcriptional regulator with XRE-family HTH domain